MELTQDMIDAAAKEESTLLEQTPEVIFVQNKHLQQRVVVLRALLNAAEQSLLELQKDPDTEENEEQA